MTAVPAGRASAAGRIGWLEQTVGASAQVAPRDVVGEEQVHRTEPRGPQSPGHHVGLDAGAPRLSGGRDPGSG